MLEPVAISNPFPDYTPPPREPRQPTYASQLGQLILDNGLPHEYRTPTFEALLSYQTPSLVGPQAARRSAQLTASQPQQAQQYPQMDFPTRIGFGVPWTDQGGNLVNDTMTGLVGPGTSIGVGLGMGSPEQRGGTVPGTAIANVPITLANFSTWGRERPLALLTYLMSGGQGAYQQAPGAVFGQDTPKRDGDIVDKFIGGLKDVGSAIFGVFDGVSQWWNNANAEQRGMSVRSLAQTGHTTVGLIDWISSELTGGAAKLDAQAIEQVAQQRGVSYLDMVAEYYDLDPQIVYNIYANPTIDDANLSALVRGQPLSRNPAVNMGLEFGKQMALFMVPYAGATNLLKGARLATEGAGFLRGLTTGERVFQAAEGAAGATRAQAARQFLGWGAKRALQLNSINTTAGWTIGGFEWGIKQLAVLGGNQQVVDALDKAMWEMPLSMNPGLNIVTAFGSHPLQALGVRAERGAMLTRDTRTGLLRGRIMIGTPGTPGEVGMLNLRTRQFERPLVVMAGAKADGALVGVGGRVVRLDPESTNAVRALEAQGIDEWQPAIFDKLGWSRQMVDTAFGPGNIDNLTLDDLRESLLYVAMQARRSELEGSGLGGIQGLAGPDFEARSESFLVHNIGKAHQLLQEQISGAGDPLVNEFKGQFWDLGALNDTNQAAAKARLSDEFIPGIAFTQFLSWVKASKVARDAFTNKEAGMDATRTPVYRSDVNASFVKTWLDALDKKYTPDELVPNAELDNLKTLGGAVESFGEGRRLMRQGTRKFKPLTRAQVDKIVASILEDEQRAREAGAPKPRESAAAFGKGTTPETPGEVERVLRVGARDVEAIRNAQATPPEQLANLAIPKKVLRAVADAERITPEALLADPAAAWGKVLAWFERRLAEADHTRTKRDTLDSFAQLTSDMHALDPRLMDSARTGAEAARDYLLNPITDAYLQRDVTAFRNVVEARRTLEPLMTQMTKLAASPLRKVRVVDAGAMGRYVVPPDIAGPWFNDLLYLIARVHAEGRGLPDGDVAALLADVHPFFKLDLLRRADLTPEELAIVERIKPDDLAAVIHDVLGPDAPNTPESAAAVLAAYDKYAAQVLDVAGQVAAAGQRFANIEGGGRSPELQATYAHLDEYSARTGQPWRGARIATTPIAPMAERDAAMAASRERLSANAAISKAAQIEADAQATIDTLTAANVIPDFDNPIRTFKVRKGGRAAAVAQAKQVNLGEIHPELKGLPTRPFAVRKPSGAIDHWEVQVGRMVRRNDAIQEAYDAGNVARGQALNVEEGVARGGTVESGGAIKAAPEPAPAARKLYIDMTPEEAAARMAKIEAASKVEPHAVAWQKDNLVYELHIDPRTGKWRVTTFDGQAPVGHVEYESYAAAISDPTMPLYDFVANDTPPIMVEPGFEQFHPPALTGEVVTPEPPPEALAALDAHVAADPNLEVVGAAPQAAPEAAPPPDALLVSGGSASSGNVPMARPDEPAFTIKANPGEPLRVLIKGEQADSMRPVRPDEPAQTVTVGEGHKAPIRAILGARVVRLTGRAIARLMGVPDSFPLPENETLARTILGNGVPPPLIRSVVDPLVPLMGENPRGVTLFSGGGLVEAGLEDRIGFVHAVEYDPKIADAYRLAHGEHMTTGDVNKIDYAQWRDQGEVGYLHASPVCKNFSPAKAKALRNTDIARDQDLGFAASTARAINDLQPNVVTIENVRQYQGTEALKIITDQLDALGYKYDINVFDAADYGVPQHRLRMILRAVKNGDLPPLPAKQPHIGWWDAVKDLDLPDDPKGLAPWQQRRLAAQGVVTEGYAGPTAAAPATAAPAPALYGGERAFDNPLDVAGEQVPARFKVVELGDLIVSGDEGYNNALQPRDRARAGSTAQIAGIVNRPKFDRYLMSETGSEGTPVVGVDNMTIAGNGRIKALRQMSDAQIEQYKRLLASRAQEFGLTPDQIEAMNAPVLVREIPDAYMTHEMAVALNAATGGMSLTETGFAIAHSLEPADLDKLDLGEQVSLRDALMAAKNQPFIQRVLGKLPEQDVRALSDSTGALNADGLRVVQTALLAKVLPDRVLVERFVESLDEGVGTIRNGIAEAIGQLTEAQALIDSGVRGPDLAIGPTLSEAVQRLIGVRERDLSPVDAQLELTGTTGMFDAGGTQTSGELAWALYGLRSANEVRDFLRAYAKAVKESPDPTQMGMFGGQTVSLTDVLNTAVREVNGLRREKYNAAVLAQRAKEAKTGQAGLLAPEERVRPPAELPGFSSPDGTIPTRFTTEAGTEGFARDIIPDTSPAAVVDARIGAANNLHLDGDPFDPATYAGTDKASGEVTVRVPNENYRVAMQDLFTRNEGYVYKELHALQEYRRRAFAFNGLGPDVWERKFNEAVERVNAGQGMGADLLWLNELSDQGLRFDGQGQFVGHYNGLTKVPDNPSLFMGAYQEGVGGYARSPLTEALKAGRQFRAVTETPTLLPSDAAVLGSAAKDTGPFQRGSGVVADLTPEKNAVKGAIDSGAHTFVKRGGVVDDAAREATGASKGNPADAVLEINPPDKELLLRLAQERLDAARVAKAEAQAKLDSLGPPPEGPVEQAPIPPDIYDLLETYQTSPGYMEKGSEAVRQEFHTVGQIVDAIESIDRGVPALGRPMSEAELTTLRAGLIDWLDKRLVAIEGTRPKGRRPTTVNEDGFPTTPEAYGDDLNRLLRELEHVVKPAEGGPVNGYEGAQYDMGFLPRRDEAGRVLSPRIPASTSLLELSRRIQPDLEAELALGRKQTVPHRTASARLSEFMAGVTPEWLSNLRRLGSEAWRQAGANPERDIRLATLNRFFEDLVGAPSEYLSVADYDAALSKARGIIGALHKEMKLPEHRITAFSMIRKEYTLTASRFERVVRQYLADSLHPDETDLPAWAQRFIARNRKSPSPFFDAWTSADNRIRNYFRDQPNGASRYVEQLYAHELTRAGSRKMAAVTMWYHTARFLLDGRWLAMERVEAPTLTLMQEGIGALVEAIGGLQRGGRVGVQRAGKISRPLFLGFDELSKMRTDWAWWLAPDAIGNLAWREHYVLTLVRRAQLRDLPYILRKVAERDPELRQTMQTFGDTPEQWLNHLNDSWEAYSALSRKITPPEAEAVFGPRLAKGIISQEDFDRIMAAARSEDGYHYVEIPALEKEIAASVGNPVMEPVMELLRQRTQDAWNDAAQLIYGQPNRSNVQRFLNHPLLWWPMSYQLKATKWLAGLMFDRFMGVETGSLGALTLDRIHSMHQQAFRDDPDYRKFFSDNKTLLFVASMFFPITPWDIGVGLSPFTRLAWQVAATGLGLPEDSPYKRNIWSVGPGYTYFNLLPRLGYELRKSTALPAQYAGQLLGTVAPYSVPVGGSSSQQTSATQQEFGANPLPQVPGFENPPTRYGP